MRFIRIAYFKFLACKGSMFVGSGMMQTRQHFQRSTASKFEKYDSTRMAFDGHNSNTSC